MCFMHVTATTYQAADSEVFASKIDGGLPAWQHWHHGGTTQACAGLLYASADRNYIEY
jgi:hypothetical protein